MQLLPNTWAAKTGPRHQKFEPARLQTDDTQAYTRMDCERGYPVSAVGVGGNGLWKK
jgi:hypothetical protein